MYVASLFKNNLQGAAIPPSPKGLGFLAVIRMKKALITGITGQDVLI